jgi:hypothetical protein
MASFDPFGILDTFSASIGDATATILGGVGAAVQQIQAIAGELRNGFRSLTDFVKGFFGKVLAALRHLHLGGFKSFLSHLWGWARKVVDLLRKVLDPIICAIKAIIDYENTIFNLYLRPILELLQRVRSTLVLLRLLHVKWAARLDDRLVHIEQAIANLGLATLRELNQLRTYINLLLDPTGLFNPATFLLSAITNIEQLWAALKNVGSRALGASELESAERDRTLFLSSELLTSTADVSAGRDDRYRKQLEDAVVRELARITGATV